MNYSKVYYKSFILVKLMLSLNKTINNHINPRAVTGHLIPRGFHKFSRFVR